MAISHRAIAVKWLKREGTIAELSQRYNVSESKIEEAIRKLLKQ